MKPLELFVVRIDDRTKETIKTEPGLELYIDTKFNEFKHRTTEGEVVAVPHKYETGVEPGDTLYFHHLVVINEGQPLTGEDKNYTVKYSPDITINNQAIAYKSKRTSEVKTLAGWSLLEPDKKDDPGPEGTIKVVTFKEDPVLTGIVSFDSPELKELGVKKCYGFRLQKNTDYSILIDGQEY